MTKGERQQQIRTLIGTEAVSRQDEIVERLRDMGHRVTQASISRDLEELGIVKIHGVYEIPQTFSRGSGLGLLSLEPAGENLLVAKCDPGLASAVTVRIDSANVAGVIGTIAGDDTVFLAIKDARSQSRAARQIWELFEGE